MFLPTPTIVVGVGFTQRFSVCLFFRTISQTWQECSIVSPGNPFILGSRGLNIKVTSHKKHCRRGFLHSCECWLYVDIVCIHVSYMQSATKQQHYLQTTLQLDLHGQLLHTIQFPWLTSMMSEVTAAWKIHPAGWLQQEAQLSHRDSATCWVSLNLFSCCTFDMPHIISEQSSICNYVSSLCLFWDIISYFPKFVAKFVEIT